MSSPSDSGHGSAPSPMDSDTPVPLGIPIVGLNPHPNRTKRNWSDDEDAMLIDILLELLATGKYRAERGFKPGLFTAVEKEFEMRKPGCGIRANPHIYSRMKTLKTHFGIVHDMLYVNTSGFGWDPINKCVTADDEVWASYIQTHKAAAQFRGKSFKFFNELATIFGLDRANGRGAADHGDATLTTEDDSMPDDNPPLSSGDDSGDGNSRDAHKRSKKRKVSQDEAFIAAVKDNTRQIVTAIDGAAEKLASAIMRSDIYYRRKELWNKLKMLPTFTEEQRMRAHRVIGGDREILDLFFSVDDDHVEEWVRAVLQ